MGTVAFKHSGVTIGLQLYLYRPDRDCSELLTDATLMCLVHNAVKQNR